MHSHKTRPFTHSLPPQQTRVRLQLPVQQLGSVRLQISNLLCRQSTVYEPRKLFGTKRNWQGVPTVHRSPVLSRFWGLDLVLQRCTCLQRLNALRTMPTSTSFSGCSYLVLRSKAAISSRKLCILINWKSNIKWFKCLIYILWGPGWWIRKPDFSMNCEAFDDWIQSSRLSQCPLGCKADIDSTMLSLAEKANWHLPPWSILFQTSGIVTTFDLLMLPSASTMGRISLIKSGSSGVQSECATQAACKSLGSFRRKHTKNIALGRNPSPESKRHTCIKDVKQIKSRKQQIQHL